MTCEIKGLWHGAWAKTRPIRVTLPTKSVPRILQILLYAGQPMPANATPAIYQETTGNLFLDTSPEPSDTILVILHDTPLANQIYQDAALAAIEPWLELAATAQVSVASLRSIVHVGSTD